MGQKKLTKRGALLLAMEHKEAREEMGAKLKGMSTTMQHFAEWVEINLSQEQKDHMQAFLMEKANATVNPPVSTNGSSGEVILGKPSKI